MPELLRAPTRHFRSPVADSHRWDSFEPRDGDIVIATFPKCGTTWTQRIVDLLVWQSPDIRPFGDISPWLDATIFNPLDEDLATLKAQRHRRYIKSHLPFDALPVWDTVKYVHVGRDARDACLSWQNHMLGTKPEFGMKIAMQAMEMAAAGAGPPMTGPPLMPQDPHDYLVQWLGEQEAALNGQPGPMSFFDFEATYWAERTRPNLLFTHYNDMKENLEGEMRRIADFLEIDTPASLLPKLAEAAAFATMKRDGDALFPKLHEAFDRGADRFINQGRSGRWREVATPADVARYDAIVARAATPALAAWLERGRLGAGDPRSAAD
jgi:aryl sulfotransferase